MPRLVSLLNPTIIILCSVCHAQPGMGMNVASTKVWARKTSQSWRNWNTRIPLGKINFPTNLEVPLAFSIKNELGCEIVIPMDDVANDEEYIYSSSSPTCPKEAGTLPDEEILWINPNNWVRFPADMINIAVPHVERIPCEHDVVRFGAELGDFMVVLPNKKINIQRISYDGFLMNRFNFKSEGKRENFVKHFVVYGEQDVLSLINITAQDCTERTGCACNTMQFYTEICDIMKPKCNRTLPCPNPIQPVGHCCPMCGVYLEMFFDPDRFVYYKFYTSSFKKLIDQSFNHHFHFSKISDRSLHVIFAMDELEHDDSKIFNFASDYANGLRDVEHLGILGYTLTSSGSYKDPNTWRRIFFNSWYLVLLGLVLIIGGYFLSKTGNKERISSVFSTSEFVKFKNSTEQNQQNNEVDKHVDISSNDNNSDDLDSDEKSDSDVFVKLQATNEMEESPTLLVKETEETEEIPYLLDFEDSLSQIKLL